MMFHPKLLIILNHITHKLGSQPWMLDTPVEGRGKSQKDFLTLASKSNKLARGVFSSFFFRTSASKRRKKSVGLETVYNFTKFVNRGN